MINNTDPSYGCIGLCDKDTRKPIRNTRPRISIKRIALKIIKQPKLTKTKINKILLDSDGK